MLVYDTFVFDKLKKIHSEKSVRICGGRQHCAQRLHCIGTLEMVCLIFLWDLNRPLTNTDMNVIRMSREKKSIIVLFIFHSLGPVSQHCLSCICKVSNQNLIKSCNQMLNGGTRGRSGGASEYARSPQATPCCVLKQSTLTPQRTG